MQTILQQKLQLFLIRLTGMPGSDKGGANPSEANLDFSTDSGKSFENLADEYIALGGESSPDDYNLYLETTNPNLKVIFLNRLTEKTSDVTYKILAKVDADYNCTYDANPEIGQRWFPLTNAHSYSEALDSMHSYVSNQGRMKYINPVYQSLVDNGNRDTAY